MGQQQSKDELLYQQVSYGNTEGIKALCREGAGLEWIDREGKTPLIVACLNPELFNVAKTLVEFGANVNAYRPGRNAGTPLHHAAKRGHVHTVKLLLFHGANSLIMNDDCQTPLEVARAKGHGNVVRAIESHICLFSGWLREFHGPGYFEVLAPQLVSRKVWVVVLPCGSRNPTKPFKLELVIYFSIQDAVPRTVIALWKCNLEEPKLQHFDPWVMIVDNVAKTRLRLASENQGDKQQLQWFCNSCKGIPQVMPPSFMNNNQIPVGQATAPPATEDLELAMAINASIHSAMQEKRATEDLELAMAINASIHSAMQERPPLFDSHHNSEAGGSGSLNNPSHISAGPPLPSAPPKTSTSNWEVNEAGQGGNLTQHPQIESNTPSVETIGGMASVPPAPLSVGESSEEGPVLYPSIDASPFDLSSATVENIASTEVEKKDDGGTCIICLDAPVEGACIPCGHMAGCMSCLNEIKAKKWGCPVCRAKIDQVVRLFVV